MGKPLISDAALQGMYQVMRQVRATRSDPAFLEGLPRAERSAARDTPEALLAAVLSQMHRRDTLLAQSEQPLLATALAATFADGDTAPALLHFPGSSAECAAAAAGYAVKQKALHRTSAPHRLTVALLRGLPDAPGVMRWMEQGEPSLILIAVGGEVESRADAQRRLLGTKVPVMPVDQADAVAVCRVMQESALRARSGWGGVLIHATAMPGAVEPLLLMEQHLRNRKLLP